MKYRKLGAGLLVSSFIFAGSLVHAETTDPVAPSKAQPADVQVKPEPKPECQCGHNRDNKRMGILAYKLSLSDEQAKQMEGYFRKQRESIPSLLAQLKASREALGEELAKVTLDVGKINQQQTQLKNIQAQVADARLNAALAARKILTPEQYAMFVDFMQKRGHWGQRGCGMGGGARFEHNRHYQNKKEGDDDSGWRQRHHRGEEEGDYLFGLE